MTYNHQQNDPKWLAFWEQTEIYNCGDYLTTKPKKYILSALPYPSGSGLHAGHIENYTASDILSRFYKMHGHQVLNPIGWDAFGLPAENFAIKSQVHPRTSTNKAIEMFISQIKASAIGFSWNREIGTHNPDYYKWTQWFFQLMYKKGLAYKKEALVNWDPVDKTVLANEQVLSDGTAERSGAKVEQIMMNQWFFKITDYVEDKIVESGPNKGKLLKGLIGGLEGLDWPESTKQMQLNWIGKSQGAVVRFKLEGSDESIEVYTTRIDTLFSGTYVILAPEHHLVEVVTTPDQLAEVQEYQEKTKQKSALERTELNKDKTAAFTGSYCINPATNERIPIWISDFVLGSYGTGAVFADAHDERDFELAKKYNIPLKTSIRPSNLEDDSKIRNLEECYSGYGILYNSGQFDGLESTEAITQIIDWGELAGWARRKINYKLRDWSVSRQRYWGCPIPVVYLPKENQLEAGKTDADWEAMLVPEADLPVILPDDVQFEATGRSPLIDHEAFHKSAEKYGPQAKREADTMDAFVCSSWYFLRYCDPHNSAAFASPENLKNWGPVDEYIIGAEHIVLHLLYARFFVKVLFDEGIINFDEPFLKMRHQGMILGEDNRKMSKRWGNVVNPLDTIAEFGADTLRVYEMFMGPFEMGKAWNTNTIRGVRRFIDKVYRQQNFVKPEAELSNFQTKNDEVEVALHKLIKKVSSDITDYSFNTAVAEFMKFSNLVDKLEFISQSQWRRFLLVLAPFAPLITEELWSQSHNLNPETMSAEQSIHNQVWPSFDESLLIESEVTIVVQVNGKVRAEFVAEKDLPEAELIEIAKQKAEKWLAEKQIKFQKVVPNKMVTFAVG